MCFFDGALLGFTDNAVLRFVQQSTVKVDYGLQRFFLSIGAGLGSITTSLIAQEMPVLAISKLSVAFFVYSISTLVLCVCSLVLYRHVDFRDAPRDATHKRRINVTQIFLETMKSAEIVFFFLVILMLGLAHGLNLGFLFPHLKALGSTQLMMGLNALVFCFSSAFMFPVAAKVIQFLGGILFVGRRSLIVNVSRG